MNKQRIKAGWPRIILYLLWAALLIPFSRGHDDVHGGQHWRWQKKR
jgi:hypothetical protein